MRTRRAGSTDRAIGFNPFGVVKPDGALNFYKCSTPLAFLGNYSVSVIGKLDIGIYLNFGICVLEFLFFLCALCGFF